MRDQYSAPRAAGTTFRFQLDLATPAGGWGRDRLNLLQAKARELAPDRHALYAPAMPGNVTRVAFLLDGDRDAFAAWIKASGVDWSEPNWRVVRG